MVERDLIRDILDNGITGSRVTVYGWVKTARKSKSVAFAVIFDGSCQQTQQAVFDRDGYDDAALARLNTGTCIRITGNLAASPGSGQTLELHAESLEITGEAARDYPLQKKRHSIEFLRSIPHLRPRTNTFSAVFRMSHHLSMAIHRFFDENGFFYIHTPIITASDAEGAGETFQITSLPLSDIEVKNGIVDYSTDYFRRQAFLTVSGQLEAEPFALAMGKVYTFGPTFRADPSDTRFHCAEFWMIEPEMAFTDLDDDIILMERFLKFLASYLKERCPEDILFFNKFYEKELDSRYNTIISADFARITYSEAIRLLKDNADEFEVSPEWSMDISTEYEKYLTDVLFKKPVFVTDYPASIKPFYMRLNDDENTVACTDLLFPEVGELIGGSQREERFEVLTARAEALGVDLDDYRWYFDLRRWGSAPHSGFGLGFERLLMYFTGMKNIRDVVPFPRSQGKMT